MGIQPLVPAYSGNRMMDIKEVAAYTQVSEETVRRWMQEGMPHKKLGYRTVRFYIEEVTTWIEHRHQAVSAPQPGAVPPSCAGLSQTDAPPNSPPITNGGASVSTGEQP